MLQSKAVAGLIMSDALSALVLFISAIEKDKAPKFTIEVLSVIAALLLWWPYVSGIAIYPGIAFVILVVLLNYWNNASLLEIKDLPLLVLASVASVGSLPLLTGAILLLRPELRSRAHYLILLVLISVSSISAGQVATQYHLSVLMLLFTLALSLLGFANRRFFAGLLWAILACRYSVFVPELLREGVLWLLPAYLLLLVVTMWCDDSEETLTANISRIGGVAVIAAAISYGEFALWGMSLAWLALEQCLRIKPTSTNELKVPWIAASTLFLIPVAPTVVYLSATKTGVNLFVGILMSTLISLGLWRWIRFAEKRSSDLSFDYKRILALLFFIYSIVIATLFSLKPAWPTLFLALGSSTVIIVAFAVLGFDEKLLCKRSRGLVLLRLQPLSQWRKEELAREIDAVGSSSAWKFFGDLGRSLTLVMEGLESLISRTLALSVLLFIVVLILMGGVSA